MAIHPGFAPLLDVMQPFLDLDWTNTPVDRLRAYADNPMAQGEPIAMARVEDVTIPLSNWQLSARLYVPETKSGKPRLTMYFHGGGWILGTLDTHDATCRALARDSGAAVLSVAYRLAPEFRYPTAAEDCYAATCWAAINAQRFGVCTSRMAVAGDSAGGNLAAAVAIMARDRGGPKLAFQLLIYPVTNRDFTTPSYLENGGGGAFLTVAAMQRFWSDYLGDTLPGSAPLAEVLKQNDLAGLPPATIIVAEHDPLRDEGKAYGRALERHGVPTTLIEAPGMIHGFFGMSDFVPDARQWTIAAAADLRRALY